MWIRVILTAIVVAVCGFFSDVWQTAAPIISGQAAVAQLNDSNIDTIAAVTVMHHANGQNGLIGLAGFIACFFIWAGFVKKKLNTNTVKTGVVALMVLLGASLYSTPSHAWYTTDINDQKEYIQIGSNQSCFFIPMTGANKSTQAQFNSEAYLNETAACEGTACTGHGKVATKRVEIPHTQVQTNGITNKNYWISTAQLQCVDRTPVNREWVGSKDRGTAVKDQAFRFETADSADAKTGIVISAFVTEEDAAKYLYWFGTKPPTTGTDDEKKYSSILYARSLEEVVDDNVHRAIQAGLAKEFGALHTTEAPTKKAAIIEKVSKDVVAQFAAQGITIRNIGYAEGISWDNPKIQAAFDDVFIAGQDAQSANLRAPLVDYNMKTAQIKVVEAQAKAIEAAANKWNGILPSLPSWMLISDGMVNWVKDTLNNMSGGKSTPTNK